MRLFVAACVTVGLLGICAISSAGDLSSDSVECSAHESAPLRFGSWTPDSVTVAPQSPTSCDEVTIMVAGTSGSMPAPYALEVAITENSLFIDVLRKIGDVTLPAVVSWELGSYIGTLPSGTYTIYTRLCTESTTTGVTSCTDYQMEKTFTVAACDSNRGVYRSEIVPGDRVVLLEPSGGLSSGHAGIVLCKGTKGFLVKWDRWSGSGIQGDALCGCGPIGDFACQVWAPPASWIARADKLGRFFDALGALVQGTECVLFQTDAGQLLVLDDLRGHTKGERFRVQGLLQSPCTTICMQGSGCIRHTITSSTDKDAYPCCDSSCTFRPGDRVVLLSDQAAAGFSLALKAGASGTILACGADTALVSWDLVTNSTLVLLDEGATWRRFQWPSGSLGQIGLGSLGKYMDLGCVMVKQRPVVPTGMIGGPPLYYDVTAGPRTYVFTVCWDCGASITGCLADWNSLLRDGANAHIRGLVRGIEIDPLISPCNTSPTDSCCNLNVGNRVVLLVNNPQNSAGQPAIGLYAGAMGTVICCDHSDPVLTLFVSWDNWTSGTNGDTWCDTEPGYYTPYSGWWVRCSDVRLSSCSGCNADFCQYEPPAVGLSPSTIQAGQSLHLSFGLANCGTASIPAGWKIRYYASADTTITSSDYFLYETVADFGIGEGLQLSVTEDFTFPRGIPAGPCYVGWILDPDNQICETNESNNAGCVTAVVITVCGGSEPAPCSRTLIAEVSGIPITLTQDPLVSTTYTGCTHITIELNFKGTLSVEATGISVAGGTWSGSLNPTTTGPGEATVELCIRGTGVNVGALPCGQTTDVATVTLFIVPVF